MTPVVGTARCRACSVRCSARCMTSRPCPVCGGVGEVIPDPCHRCGGDGRVRARREVSVKIPAGVGEGMRVRLAAQGEVGPGGGPAGDLYVEVHEQPHDIFIRDGDDLHCTVSVPDGRRRARHHRSPSTRSSTAPPRSPSRQARSRDRSSSLRGHGMPHLRSGVRGNLHAHIEVVVPSRLDPQDIELLRKLKEHRVRDAAEVKSTHAASGERRPVQPAARDLHRSLGRVDPRMSRALFYVDCAARGRRARRRRR